MAFNRKALLSPEYKTNLNFIQIHFWDEPWGGDIEITWWVRTDYFSNDKPTLFTGFSYDTITNFKIFSPLD